MRKTLRVFGFTLIAGEYPGGTDHELYPLNVTDPALARDFSPDPRRHSYGEMIPDIVALKGRALLVGEAKVDYDYPDQVKLSVLMGSRRADLIAALEKFAEERGFPVMLPINTLKIFPALIFTDRKAAPALPAGLSYLILGERTEPKFVGPVAEVVR